MRDRQLCAVPLLLSSHKDIYGAVVSWSPYNFSAVTVASSYRIISICTTHVKHLRRCLRITTAHRYRLSSVFCEIFLKRITGASELYSISRRLDAYTRLAKINVPGRVLPLVIYRVTRKAEYSYDDYSKQDLENRKSRPIVAQLHVSLDYC